MFTEANRKVVLADKVMEQMAQDNITFLTSRNPLNGEMGVHEDWRDVATKTGLRHSDAEWVWFIEQDLIIPGDFSAYWRMVVNQQYEHTYFGTYQEGRLHPCNLFVWRPILDKINVENGLDFSAKPPKYDHFGKLQMELKHYDGGTIEPRYYEHLNGYTHNYHLLMDGQRPNHDIDRFREVLTECLRVDVGLIPEWVQIVHKFIDEVAN